MHNSAFTALKMDACYVPFPVHPDRLREAVGAVIPLRLSGLNITVPHKEKIIPYLDELSQEARLIGAVNTIEIREEKLIGHNTDGRGFLRSLKEQAGFNPKGKRFLLIGSGGAARAVAFSLALSGASKILLRDVDAEKADLLAGDISKKTNIPVFSIPENALSSAASEADCLINATPLGLKKGDPLPVPNGIIEARHLVADLVYNPPATPLLKAAKAKKAKVLSGLGMLLFQGVIAFEIWTGKKAPVAVMQKALSRQFRG
jgi:shikimate dehydrogenase